MYCLIDGYNVTKRDPATRDLSLEEQRCALVERLRLHARELLGTNDFRIVWDAAGGIARSEPTPHKERYTRMPSADDSIVNEVAQAHERITVVTSDKELANRCEGAATAGVVIIESSVCFASALDSKAAKKRRGRRSNDVGIPAGANKINEELKQIWGIED